MSNKVLVELIVPDLEEKFNIFIPINRRVGNIIVLVNKALNELTNGNYPIDNNRNLYNRVTGYKYFINDLVRQTDIRNGTMLILI